MRVLVIGSGGREHAIVWALKRTSARPLELFCAPGNGGISEVAQSVAVAATDVSGLASFARDQAIDLTFVGPEAPLAAGIVDVFDEMDLTIVGPGALAARLEASKVFAKEFMGRHHIPTAKFRVAESASEAMDILRSGAFGNNESPVVVKADGLAAGKGVIVASSRSEAERAIDDLMVRHSAGVEAATRVVLEEALSGPEVSLLVFADGKDYAVMPASRDHKRIGENDTGPNTGGMGTITDASLLDTTVEREILETIVEPTLAGAAAEVFPFRGVLFLGLMLTRQGPKLLEYNVRFGDPETQAILIRLKTDLLSVFEAIENQTLGNIKLDWLKGSSACVVLANQGYPGSYKKGAEIKGLDRLADDSVQVFHAGTERTVEGKLLATGGRVLGVTAAAPNLEEALQLCYGAIGSVSWEGMQYRRDIGRSV